MYNSMNNNRETMNGVNDCKSIIDYCPGIRTVTKYIFIGRNRHGGKNYSVNCKPSRSYASVSIYALNSLSETSSSSGTGDETVSDSFITCATCILCLIYCSNLSPSSDFSLINTVVIDIVVLKLSSKNRENSLYKKIQHGFNQTNLTSDAKKQSQFLTTAKRRKGEVANFDCFWHKSETCAKRVCNVKKWR